MYSVYRPRSHRTVARAATAFMQSGGNRFIWPSLLRDRAVTARLVLVYENVAVPVPPDEAGGPEVGENEGADADVPLPDHRPPEMHAAGVPAGRGQLGRGELEPAQRLHSHRQRAPGGLHLVAPAQGTGRGQ